MNDIFAPHLSRRWDEPLCHYGIKNMKWGERRFQNEDGSLTDAGLKRFYRKREQKKLADEIGKYSRGESTTKRVIKTKKGKKKVIEENTNEKLRNSAQVNDAVSKMKAESDEYDDAVAKQMPHEDNIWTQLYKSENYEKYFQKAVDNYAKSHLSTYNGDRAQLEDDFRKGLVGGGEKAMFRLYMNDHSSDDDVKQYRKLSRATAEAKTKLDIKSRELSKDILGKYGKQSLDKDSKKKKNKKEREKSSDDLFKESRTVGKTQKELSDLLSEIGSQRFLYGKTGNFIKYKPESSKKSKKSKKKK